MTFNLLSCFEYCCIYCKMCKIRLYHVCTHQFAALSWISKLCWCGPQYLLTVFSSPPCSLV